MRNISLLFLLGIYSFGLTAQNDSLFEYVIVQKDSQELPGGRPVRVLSKQDFYRNKALIRLHLFDPGNQTLSEAKPVAGSFEGQYGKTKARGIVDLLLEGLRQNQIEGYHPRTLRSGYDYAHIRQDLMRLEEIDPHQSTGLDLDDLGAEWMQEYMDLIVDKGFSAQQSQAFIRVKFLRLIWRNPNSLKGDHALVIFRFEEVAPLLEKMQIEMPHHANFELTVKEFLEQSLFQPEYLPMTEAQLKTLATPPPRHRIKEPDLWEN